MSTLVLPELELPTEATPPAPAIESSKTLLYGPPKIGKTTTARDVAGAEETIFLATEEGQGAMSVKRLQIETWLHFRAAVRAAVQTRDRGKMFVVDTVDELVRMCADHVITELGGSAGQAADKKYMHASDFGYGKGWQAIEDEFRLRVGALCRTGRGVIFISHEKQSTVNTRAGEIVVSRPDMSGGPGRFMEGFVDFIFYAQLASTPEGDQRLLRTQPTQFYQAGGRVPEGLEMPDPLPLSGKALRAALEALGGKRGDSEAPAGEKGAEAQTPPKRRGGSQAARKAPEKDQEAGAAK